MHIYTICFVYFTPNAKAGFSVLFPAQVPCACVCHKSEIINQKSLLSRSKDGVKDDTWLMHDAGCLQVAQLGSPCWCLHSLHFCSKWSVWLHPTAPPKPASGTPARRTGTSLCLKPDLTHGTKLRLLLPTKAFPLLQLWATGHEQRDIRITSKL